MLPISEYLEQRQEPSGEPAMLQSWHNLCFLHYSVAPDSLRSHLPDELEVDTFPDADGVEQAWIGIVAFTMSEIRLPGSPAIPWLSSFAETNVRTYVHHKNKGPGVWFFSLDASRWLACEYAKKFFQLNYLHSEMNVKTSDNSISYQIRRIDEPHASLELEYEHETELNQAKPGTFEFWLVERYKLYTVANGSLMQGQVFHSPYEIAPVTIHRFESDLPQSIGLPSGTMSHKIYSPGVDVKVFPLVHVQ